MNYFVRLIYSNIFVRYSKLFSRKNLYAFMGKSINNYLIGKNLNILVIGAGGETSNYLLKKNIKFKEIDIDKKRKPDYVMSVERMDKIKSNSVDVIFCMEVLEHVQNPFNGVNEIRRVLKKDGIFIGSTPFIFPIHDKPYDFYRYTKYGILNLFKDFKKLELAERNGYFETIYVLILRLFNMGNNWQKIVAVLLFPIFVLILPLIFILNLIVSNEEITTGYFYVFKK